MSKPKKIENTETDLQDKKAKKAKLEMIREQYKKRLKSIKENKIIRK